MLPVKWIKIIARILLYLILFAFFCYFYMIDQMSDFIKGRTTVTSRIEKVESLEPPTVTICMNPPYKSSKLKFFGLNNFYQLYKVDFFNNQTVDEAIDFFGYKLGRDFSVNMLLGFWPDRFENWNVSVGMENIGNFQFETQPIYTNTHGRCYKIQPQFSITSPDILLHFQTSISSVIDDLDVPTSIIYFLTSNDTWQGITTNFWPQYRLQPIKSGTRSIALATLHIL